MRTRDEKQALGSLDQLDKILEKDPTRTSAQFNKGNVLLRLCRLQEALLAYDRLIVVDRLDLAAHDHRGVVLRELGRPEQAIESYHRALSLDATHAGVHNNLGIALEDLGCWEDAEKAYLEAVRLDPTAPLYWTNLGQILLLQGRFDAAWLLFEQRLGMRGPGETEARLGLGEVHLAVGDATPRQPRFSIEL